jgi:phosphate transport system permease protein
MSEATADEAGSSGPGAVPESHSAAMARLLPKPDRRRRLRRWRYIKDQASRIGVAIGGGSVVFALALIFVYLFIEVLPMFRGASVEPQASYAMPGTGPQDDAVSARTDAVVLERYLEIAARIGGDGRVTFFGVADGLVRATSSMPVPADVTIASYGAGDARERVFAQGLSDGRVVIGQLDYRLIYPDGERYIQPSVQFPVGEDPVVLDPEGRAVVATAVQNTRQGHAVAGVTADQRVLLAIYRTTTNFMTGARQVTPETHRLPPIPAPATHILLDRNLRSVFVADTTGRLHVFDITRPAEARLRESVRVVPRGVEVTALQFLVGTVSVIVGGSDGSLSQWFPVRDEANEYYLEKIRTFAPHAGSVRFITPEYGRKGFYTGDSLGNLGVHYATSSRTLFSGPVAEAGLTLGAVSPTNSGLLYVAEDGTTTFANLWNEHPQISWSALWSKVRYEGRAEENYVWQSSSASDDFESKFSMVPLTVGTLKAAFYAMLFAMPLAIMGAVYSAYFMTPKMRSYVKPTIEIMEALPTVILGFLAGLWLAPFVESNLPAVFGILLLMPLAMLAMAAVWGYVPAGIRHRVGPGWEAALLIPVILLVGWWCIRASPYVELLLFGGSMRQWLTDVGITYDQRNAMIVGIAMGFAVIPTIFSIAEDAVFNVPKHLTQGSLALGATAWQTVVGVVLPTASPGIFSAVMIGFGRAVGETMIVLMATGNSPIVNFNIFEGMRTLSANIAVELPETAVSSSHYRILFLAALVLFGFTFIVNTIAEVVRQRLRTRYASL